MHQSPPQAETLENTHGVRFSLRSVLVVMTVTAVVAAVLGPWIYGLSTEQQWRLGWMSVAGAVGAVIAVPLHFMRIKLDAIVVGLNQRTFAAQLPSAHIKAFSSWPTFRLNYLLDFGLLVGWIVCLLVYIYFGDASNLWYVAWFACGIASAFFFHNLTERSNYVIMGDRGLFVPTLRDSTHVIEWSEVKPIFASDGTLRIEHGYADPECIATIPQPQSTDVKAYFDAHRIKYVIEST